MTEYEITLSTQATRTYKVSARTQEEAEEKAFRLTAREKTLRGWTYGDIEVWNVWTAEDSRSLPARLAVNPDPLEVTEVKSCRICSMRAPWCSCGQADYA